MRNSLVGYKRERGRGGEGRGGEGRGGERERERDRETHQTYAAINKF